MYSPIRHYHPETRIPIHPAYLLDVLEAEGSTQRTKEALHEEEKPGHGKAVRCAYCKSVITYQGNAESIQGRHIHSFVNPAGYEFTIGCYRRAWCRIMGLPMLEWSWFNGHTWQYAMCPQCQEHLGWFYHTVHDNNAFYGLILDRLIIEES